VTATAGAFLVGLAGTVPVDIGLWIDPTFKKSVSDGFRQPGLVVLLKYGYASWLTVYFFLSTFSVKHAELKEGATWGIFIILFDFLQSFSALATIFYLGFVNSSAAHDSRHGFIVANSAIFVISFFSWLIFAYSSDGKWNGSYLRKRSKLNSLRWFGMSLSLLGSTCAIFGHPGDEGSAAFFVLWASFLGLLGVLGTYGWMVCYRSARFMVESWSSSSEKSE
jgi:hypothetical protein